MYIDEEGSHRIFFNQDNIESIFCIILLPFQTILNYLHTKYLNSEELNNHLVLIIVLRYKIFQIIHIIRYHTSTLRLNYKVLIIFNHLFKLHFNNTLKLAKNLFKHLYNNYQFKYMHHKIMDYIL